MLLRLLAHSARPGLRAFEGPVQRFVCSAHVPDLGKAENVAKQPSSSTVDAKEVAKFAALSQEWWNPKGPFAGLRALNEARVPFIKAAATHTSISLDDVGPGALRGKRLLDVGCGGGLLAEPLARLGGDVTGIDVTSENIEVAKNHMELDPGLQGRLR